MDLQCGFGNLAGETIRGISQGVLGYSRGPFVVIHVPVVDIRSDRGIRDQRRRSQTTAETVLSAGPR
jgi:hypothetical protein